MRRPRELETKETLQFVLDNIPAGHSRILEVGCGGGELAYGLHQLGHDVVAIDSSEEAIKKAREKGVDAKIACFPDFSASRFDVIIFSRSLHHISPLNPAIERANLLLYPEGVFIVEDFAFNDNSKFAAEWFYRLLTLLHACGTLRLAKACFGQKILAEGGEISVWQEHTSGINTEEDVQNAINKYFEIQQVKSAPYLYRYVSDMLPEDDSSEIVLANISALEKLTGARVDSLFLGRRIVASPRNV